MTPLLLALASEILLVAAFFFLIIIHQKNGNHSPINVKDDLKKIKDQILNR